jgi:hypothetical protein
MATGRIGSTPVLRVRWSDQPAAGTTVLSGLDDNSVALVYDAGYEAVYRNGALLSRGNDYTATDGTTVTLLSATLAGDIIEIFANDLVPLTDAISKGQYTAKGALLSATAASTPGVLAVGTNGQVLTAASGQSTGLQWTTLATGSTFSGCEVSQGSAQSIPNGSTTTLNFDTETFDVDGYHDTVTNNSRLTIPAGKTGYFLIYAKLNMTANATGSYQGLITRNGSQLKTFGSKNNTSINGEPGITFVASAVPTNYFEFKVYQDQGGSLNTISGVTATTFGITYLGA